MLLLNMGAFCVTPKCSKWIMCVCWGAELWPFPAMTCCVSARTPCDVGTRQRVKMSMTKNTPSQPLTAMSTQTVVRVKIRRDHNAVKTRSKRDSIDHTDD